MYAVTLSHGPVYSAQLERMVEASWIAGEAISTLHRPLKGVVSRGEYFLSSKKSNSYFWKRADCLNLLY